MGLEQKINQQLNKYPAVKRIVKSVYQHTMYALSSKTDHEGNVVRLSPNDSEHEYFFGYYDKSPWDATGRYVLCLRANDTWTSVAPKEPAEILLIDTAQNNKATKIATTHSWNVQQGCMAQWLGPKFDSEIIYNDFRNGRFVSVVLNAFTGVERVLKMPVYSVAADGSFALTLDFTRLHRLRPGYGYSNVEEATKNEKIPDAACIWKLDIVNDTVTPVLKYSDFATFEPRKEMAGAEHILTTEPDIKVIGLDNMNDYYDVRIKEARLAELQKFENYTFIKGNLADKALINSIFEQHHPDIVVNLGAQAGVRYSITNPDAYIESNMLGFYNILEACRHYPVEHLVYASSSSVYGSNKKVPYSTDDKVDNPVSLYAATKKSNELMAHAYAKLYNIPSTGLRFFTVYGPAGRPDMAYFGFTNKLVKGDTIKIFNYGNCKRDFTYIDDIVEGVVRVMKKPPEKKDGEDGLPIPPYAVYNIGNSNPENLLDFVQILSEELVRAGVLPADYDFEAHKELVPMQPGDVPVTYADTSALERDFGFKPHTPLREGLRKFAEWYKEFYSE